MSFFKMLKQEIIDQIIYDIDADCDKCPSFISKHCKAEEAEEAKKMTNLEKLKTATPEQTQKKDWRKLKEELCNEIGGCDKCPPAISKHCDEAFKAMEDWKKPQEPKDAPKGWIKLKKIKNCIYINVSKIVAVGLPDPADVSNGVAATVHTVGAEDDPWLVYDSVEEVMQKIGEASQEK